MTFSTSSKRHNKLNDDIDKGMGPIIPVSLRFLIAFQKNRDPSPVFSRHNDILPASRLGISLWDAL